MALFQVRLESIGGLGAHLAGQMLAETAALEMGLSAQHFSSYGSEKKGSPVKSYVRLNPPDQPLRGISPVREPDLVAVFQEQLLNTPDVTQGLRPGCTLIVNSSRAPAELAAQVALPGVTVVAVDALQIAVEEKTRVNTAMIGAIVAAAPVWEAAAVVRTIGRTFGVKYPHLVAANLRTFERGAAEGRAAARAAAAEGAAPARPGRGPVRLGYLTQEQGGLISRPGNSAWRDLSASRSGFIPVLERGRCVDCAICDLSCPDLCFVWEEVGELNGRPRMRLAGIDYQYCKGCLRCVMECPTGALASVRETRGLADQLTVRLLPTLTGGEVRV